MKTDTDLKDDDIPGQDRAASAVGKQIRELRKARGQTLTELAGKVGRSVGHLSELERGISPITIETLSRIADALDVSVSWFFSAPSAEKSPESRYVIRKGGRREINLSSAGLREELLSPNLSGSIQMVLTTFGPGGGTGEEGRARKGDEGGFVVSGQLELVVDGLTILLEAGDSFQLAGQGHHRCRNPGATDAVIVWCFGSTKF
ncbi:helix-turn-helix domain-containing protein [Chachezhania sediminis]|uniref:helix-turn-helix domain-containing protein n=1 Tax=Chachezhania sediminis TaxID=2599291 RepID=UPI00131EC73B|nr:XRE family transcriptional regulator [Chachezhania sediminis]